ncbi:hypothetical protein DFP72DRAFT_1073684 [Ephemerocybe angulata]|uniref:Uncharacterized protein n=1 Tax=Ephemerocybe angulata TaxID=980116 RepID=A0A8H6HLC4_9AGAR|nr:hypothetical protein DFP72DRAFT_1073684 [Tulosesus angulatus]
MAPGSAPPDAEASTWRERNPDRPVNPSSGTGSSGTSTSRIQSAAQRASAKIRAGVTKIKKDALNKDLRDLKLDIEDRVKEVAKRHSAKVLLIKKLLNLRFAYTKTRKVNLANAKLHRKAAEMNEGLSRGQRHKRADIQSALKEDPKYQDTSPEFEAELLRDLEEFRELNQTAPRVSNAACALDASLQVEKIQQELEHLHERTGTASLLLLARNSRMDTVVPSLVDTAGAKDFIPEMMGVGPGELLHEFDDWSVRKTMTAKKKSKAGTLQAEIKFD